MNERVGVIGCFGADEALCDGQTVKTRNLAMLFERFGGVTVRRADTYFLRKNPMKLLWDTLACMLTCRHVFLMVSVNGMRFYLPFLYYVNKLTRRRIYHYVIGSELLELTQRDPRLVRYLNALAVNWFEYDSGTRRLRELGVTNAETLPNCKLLTPVPVAQPYDAADGVFRLCTFSRVMEEKGITEAVETVARINAEAGRTVVLLDIYGPVDREYQQTFDELLRAHPDCAAYRGVADSESSVEILKDYYALLFPTHWAGEGVPGTVIDAFASGLPVIASDWNANRELIGHMEQGLLYPEGELRTLCDAVRWAISHPDALARMRIASRASYEHYAPESIFDAISKTMKGANVK